MRAAILGLAALGLTAGGAIAAPPAPCTIDGALGFARLEVLQREAELAKAQEPLLDEMSKLSEKAPDPERPVGEQLPWRDVARMEELSTKFQAGRLSDYVLSGRERDLEIAQEMIDAAKARHTRVPTSDDDAKGEAVLLWMRQTFSGPLAVEGSQDRSACGLDTLLHAEAAGAIDPEYQRDLTEVRYWLWASDEIFNTRELDLANYPGDMSKLGTEIQRKLSSYSDRDTRLLRLWMAVDQTYRSRASLDLEEIAKQSSAQ